jgi:hypothetical protein
MTGNPHVSDFNWDYTDAIVILFMTHSYLLHHGGMAMSSALYVIHDYRPECIACGIDALCGTNTIVGLVSHEEDDPRHN